MRKKTCTDCHYFIRVKGVEMAKYKFKLVIDYEVEAEDEEEALYQLADLIRRDWPYYLDEGDLEKVEAGARPTIKN